MFKITLIAIFSFIVSCKTEKKHSSATKSANDDARERPKIKDSIARDYYSKGLDAMKQEKLTDAESYFSKADKIENNNPLILNALASMAYALGDSLRGESLYLHIISIDSVYALAYLNYAKHLLRGHQLERANGVLLKAIHHNPDDYYKGRIYHELALLNVDLNNCDSAIEYAKKAKVFSVSQDLSYLVEDIYSLCNH
jgi:tetratricopeptide (TPR) repeat protein